MTCRRSDIVDENESGIYHCVSRCVRRAFLCGNDPLSGKSFEHRRNWIRSRLSFLSSIFAIETFSYAVMSNHLHSLVCTRPDIAESWSDEEVARRWRTLFPLQGSKNGQPATPSEEEIEALVLQPELIALYRKRLSSISWFNRCLNENIARRANEEDCCTGRFWEGRFKCKRVYDTAGIIACSVYVDLNPIRSGMATTPEQSDHTSIQDRIWEYQGTSSPRSAEWAKIPLVSIAEMTNNALTLPEYIELVDETGRLIVNGKGSISSTLAPVLTRLGISTEQWVETTKHLGRKFRRIIAPEDQIKHAASKVNRRWFHGLSSARSAFVSTSIIHN